MKADSVDSTSSQLRIPDSRLPGVEPLTPPSGDEFQKKAEDDIDDGGYELSVLALWPVFVMMTIAITCAVCTSWYGATKVIQVVLQLLVPESPTTSDILAVWLAIVGCIVLGIPVLLLLLPIPAMMVGFFKGFLLTASAETVAACLSFVIGRYIAQRPVRRFLESRGCKRIMRMLHVMEDQEDQSMQLLILYRFITMPMACRNYGPAILNVPISKLVVSAIPHSIWSGMVFATVGSALKGPAELIRDGHKIAWRTPHWQQILGLLMAFLSFFLFAWIATRAYWRKVEAEEAKRLLKGPEEGVPAHYGSNSEAAIEVQASGS